MDIENLITAEEVAAVLGISAKTIKAKHKKMGIPCYKLGNSTLRFRMSDIEEWILSRKQDVPKVRVVRDIRRVL